MALILNCRQEALEATISEKDAHLALLEMASTKTEWHASEIQRLILDRKRLMEKLKQEVSIFTCKAASEASADMIALICNHQSSLKQIHYSSLSFTLTHLCENETDNVRSHVFLYSEAFTMTSSIF